MLMQEHCRHSLVRSAQAVGGVFGFVLVARELSPVGGSAAYQQYVPSPSCRWEGQSKLLQDSLLRSVEVTYYLTFLLTFEFLVQLPKRWGSMVVVTDG